MKIYYYSHAVGKVKPRHVGLLPFLIHWLEKIAKYAPLVATADAFLYQFFPAGLPIHLREAVILVLAFVLYNALIFCNGWMIALAGKGDPDWKLIFGGCFIYTFGATAISVYRVLQLHFPANPMISVIVALWVAYFVYTRFHFLRDEAPPVCARIYKAGLRTGGDNP